jgi:hypothetical protein
MLKMVSLELTAIFEYWFYCLSFPFLGLQPQFVKDDPRALCKTEGIRMCLNYGTGSGRKTARLDNEDLQKLYNDKIDDAAAFNSMREHVVVQNALDPLKPAAIAIVYFWLELHSNENLLGENAVDSLLSGLHVGKADVFLVSYEDFLFCTFIIISKPCSYFELSAILSLQLLQALSRLIKEPSNLPDGVIHVPADHWLPKSSTQLILSREPAKVAWIADWMRMCAMLFLWQKSKCVCGM